MEIGRKSGGNRSQGTSRAVDQERAGRGRGSAIELESLVAQLRRIFCDMHALMSAAAEERRAKKAAGASTGSGGSAGSGQEADAASLGATEVVATDASPGVLELIEAAAAAQDLGVVRTQVFDFLGDAAASPVRGVDIAVAADLLYTEEITRAVARTCAALKTGGAAVIVTDSQRRHRDAFLDELDRCLPRADREFEATTVSDYTGWSYPDAGDVSVEAITVGVLRLM